MTDTEAHLRKLLYAAEAERDRLRATLDKLRRLIALADGPPPGPLLCFVYLSRRGVASSHVFRHARIRIVVDRPEAEGESGLFALLRDCGRQAGAFAVDRLALEPEAAGSIGGGG